MFYVCKYLGELHGLWNLSSLTRDWTANETAESKTQDCQGIPSKSILNTLARKIILKDSYLFTTFLQARLLLSQRWGCNIPGWGEASRDLASWLPSSGSYTWSNSTSRSPPAPPRWWKLGDSCPGWWAQLVLGDSVPHSRAHLQPAGGGNKRKGRRGRREFRMVTCYATSCCWLNLIYFTLKYNPNQSLSK